jgi:catechol 2,3-dioxygenase-like lactoylglutathione lyase family enzyme
MINQVTHVSLLVRDQEEALAWYTEKLGFEVRADDPFPDNPHFRWVTVAPPGQTGLEIILQPPQWGPEGDAESRAEMIGKPPGFVLGSTDCRKDYQDLTARGVQFISPPEDVPWGVSALFVDLYGYVHNLVETRQAQD